MDRNNEGEVVRIPDGKLAVIAKYIDQKLPEYNANPLIQALPPILSADEFIDKVTRTPDFDDEERNLEARYRFHCIERLSRYFDPQNKTVELQKRICALIMTGYLARNVLKPEYAIESKGIHYYAASLDNCLVVTDIKNLANQTLKTLFTLTNDINLLIHSNFAFKGLAWLRAQYQRYLVSKGLLQIFPAGKFKFDEYGFSKLIFDFYGQESLEALNPKLTQHQGKYFSHCLLGCDLNPSIDRITHILIIKYLANSIEVFFL
ncbi:hypothetical protein [Nostoc sp.]|uniref:hypothetical protein n=1 Tax=Nostoc sp. TaxID=1180 RepID=UPI002FF7B2EE